MDLKYKLFPLCGYGKYFYFLCGILKAPLLQTAYSFMNVTVGIHYNNGEN